jgi:hypothetical protein
LQGRCPAHDQRSKINAPAQLPQAVRYVFQLGQARHAIDVILSDLAKQWGWGEQQGVASRHGHV